MGAVVLAGTLTGPTSTAASAPAALPSTATAQAAAAAHAGAALAHTDESTSAVLGPGVPTRRVAARTTARWSGAVRTSNRYAVAQAYKRQFGPHLYVKSGWTGSVSGCRVGSQSKASMRATQRAVNFVRSLNGLAPVSVSAYWNKRAMRTALLMEANGRLSHYPTTAWRCWTRAGDATAARSNIALSSPRIHAGRVVDMYMDDRGAHNTAVGHRRWLLYPFTKSIGIGSTTRANAIVVTGPRTDNTRPNPRWTSWPSAGYFPGSLEPAGRWSMSSGIRNENFNRAKVRVWKNGKRIHPRKLRVQNGYGMPTIVWQMPAEKVRRGTYAVQVAGITRPGVKRAYNRVYRVRIFNSN